MTKKSILDQLPESVSVSVVRGKSGAFIGEITELGVFTEVDDLADLDFNINDLIFTYYDLPKKYYGFIWYRPVKQINKAPRAINRPASYSFRVLASPSLVR